MCAALAELEAGQGDPAAARHWRVRAAAEGAFIAEHVGAPELRALFLARPDVRKIAAGAG